jgi:hypothetical protein
MVTEAIWEDKKWAKGSSRADIRSYIIKNYTVDETKLKSDLTTTLSKMLEDTSAGDPCLIKLGEANYKLHPEWRKEWKRRNGIRAVKRQPKKPKDAPKGPRNAYLFFMQDVRQRRQEQYPDKDPKEIMKLIGQEWNEIKEKRKQKYLDLAEEDKRRYKKEKKAYDKKKKRETSDSESESVSRSRSRSPRKKKTSTKRRDDSDSESRGKKKRRHESSEESEKDHKKLDDDSDNDRKKKDKKHKKT